MSLHPLPLGLFLLVLLAIPGCGPRESTVSAPASRGDGAGAGPAVTEADLAPVLAELTQALRKFSVEQRKVPGSLNELVAAGYLRAVPAAPAGKSFGIDARNLQVVLR